MGRICRSWREPRGLSCVREASWRDGASRLVGGEPSRSRPMMRAAGGASSFERQPSSLMPRPPRLRGEFLSPWLNDFGGLGDGFPTPVASARESRRFKPRSAAPSRLAVFSAPPW